MRTGMFFPNSVLRTKAQLAIWEITVATAAPETPMWRPKMKIGSRMMFSAAPRTTEYMPVFAKP